MTKILPSNAGGAGSIPGQEAKIPHTLGPKKTKQKTEAVVTNSRKTLKMVHNKKIKKNPNSTCLSTVNKYKCTYINTKM